MGGIVATAPHQRISSIIDVGLNFSDKGAPSRGNAVNLKQQQCIEGIEKSIVKQLSHVSRILAIKSILMSSEGKLAFEEFLVRDKQSISKTVFESFIVELLTYDIEKDMIMQCGQEMKQDYQTIFEALPHFLCSDSFSTWRSTEIANGIDSYFQARSNGRSPGIASPKSSISSPFSRSEKAVKKTEDFNIVTNPVQSIIKECDIPETEEIPLSILHPITTSIECAGDTTKAVFSHISTPSLEELLHLEPWLLILLCQLENMPIGVTLSAVSSKRSYNHSSEEELQLVYVNNYYQTMSGYTRDDIIGRSSSFLCLDTPSRNTSLTLNDLLRKPNVTKSSKSTETGKDVYIIQPDSAGNNSSSVVESTKQKRKYSPMLQSFLSGFSVSTQLSELCSCHRKNGQKFLNFLSLKPLYNRKMDTQYVICIQFDVTEDWTITAANSVAYHLMSIIPQDVVDMKGSQQQVDGLCV